MATACSDIVAMAAGGVRADQAAALVPKDGWQRLSCAGGSKGPRLYDWALIGTAEGPGRHLLVRRSLQPGEKGTLELAFFRCWSPRPVTLPGLAAVAGARWGIEDCFAEAKGEAGLDHYQVRRYAFVKDENGRDLIPLTAAEARRLFNLHTRVTRPAGHHRHWSHWRRRQAATRKSRYARRLAGHERPSPRKIPVWERGPKARSTMTMQPTGQRSSTAQTRRWDFG